MSVFRRPDLRPKSLFSPPRKSSPCSLQSSSEKSLRSPSSLFLLTPIVLLLGSGQQASPRIPVNSVGGVHLSEPLLAPYLFGPFLLSQAFSQAGDKLPFQSLTLKSSPLAPDWTPVSLCRRFNELRHLLCSVTHGVGKNGTVGTEKKYYIKKVWPKRQFLKPGVENEENEPLVASEKIPLPPLHIKLGLMKNFVKAMDCGGRGFQYLCLKFPKVSETKIKEGIFVGPQFRQLMKDPVFEIKLTKMEAAAWTSSKELEKSVFGNHKAEN
ncbi:hypothetical protein AVEN_144321-1 [Araneus ventricosus]|uniref:Uncharacterized protein n=1 Tax=Araneus ventricosus TaxID=182803 RepID=A0A4Y2J7J0_ARAVE|nr:hypothetical protein AVEN_144321-1 [Araneus ventricosus]